MDVLTLTPEKGVNIKNDIECRWACSVCSTKGTFWQDKNIRPTRVCPNCGSKNDYKVKVGLYIPLVATESIWK